MSIIHDALKKVQDKNAREAHAKSPAPTPPPAAQTTTSAAVTRPDRENRLVILLLGTLIIGILIFAIITNMPKRPTEQVIITASQIPITNRQPVPQLPPAQKPLAATAPAPAPLPAQPKASPEDPFAMLRVEGIMDMGGEKKVALINGNIYEEGQTIYGRIIAQITLDSVTIVDDGKKRTFPVNPPKP